MIRLVVGNIENFGQRLRVRGARIIEGVRVRMDRALIELQAHIQREHLSAPPGPSPTLLHQRSGKLIGSIRVEPAEIKGDRIEGAVLGGGGPVLYARVHEYGGSWTVPAREAVRMRYTRSGKLIGAKTFAVRDYTVHMPERSFMRASLAEMKERIVFELREAMKG
jgi:phage gpG-like protein